MMDAPKRRYQLKLTLGADNPKAILGTIYSMLWELEQHDLEDKPYHSVSGGYDCGYALDIDVDTTVTHESYEATLDEYLSEKRNEAKQP